MKEFKHSFCAQDDQELDRIDFFETYAPVVQWTSVCLMLILENLLGVKSKQADVTVVFLHDALEEDEEVYVEMSLGFKQLGSNRKFNVLCLTNILYSLQLSLCAFWEYHTQKLGNCCLPKVPFEPCLLISENVITIYCVFDLIFWGKNEKDIDDLAVPLHSGGVDLELGDAAADFLGVHIKHCPKTAYLNMKQNA